MNSRTAAVVAIALFALCIVSSLAFGGLYVASKLAEELDEKAPPVAAVTPPSPAPVEDPSDEPPAVTPSPTATPSDEVPTADDFEPADYLVGQFAVFHVGKPKQPGPKALAAASKGTGLKLYFGEVPDDAPEAYVQLQQLATKDYAVLKGSALDGARGVDDAAKKHLLAATHVSVLDVRAPAEPRRLKALAKVVGAYAHATGGVLWDEEVREYLSAAQWQKRRVDSWEGDVPNVAMNISVFLAEEEGVPGLTVHTGGLRHFGVAELRLEGVARSSSSGAGNLLNALAQRLVDEPALGRPGRLELELSALKSDSLRSFLESLALENGTRKVPVVLEDAPDIDEAITLRVAFEGAGAATERIEAGLAQFFGSKDRVDKIEHDEELEALSKQQMEIYRTTLKKRFRKGLAPGEVLMVKAPFQTSSGGNEWMWVEVTRLGAGGQVEGLLNNDPNDVPELRSGAKVTVKESELFDWLFNEADGGVTGNETGKVMLKRLGRPVTW